MEIKSAFKSSQSKKVIMQYYEAQLDKCPFSMEKILLSTRHGNTFALAYGDKDAPPLILLHGGGMNSLMWVPLMESFSRSYRIYAVDIPGEPGKSAENQLPLKGSYYSDWLYDVFEAAAIQRGSLLGISFGGWLAAKFAANHPEKINSLKLLSPLGIASQKSSFLLLALYYLLQGKRGKEKLFRRYYGKMHVSEESIKFHILVSKHYNTRYEMIPLLSDTEFDRLTMPVSLYLGEEDIIIHPTKTAQRLKKLVPQASITILNDAGHSIPLTSI